MSFARPEFPMQKKRTTTTRQLMDLDTDRVDGVDKPATRRSFMLFKRQDGVSKSVTETDIRQAWSRQYPNPVGGGTYTYVESILIDESAAIVCEQDRKYKVPFEISDDGEISFDPDQAKEVKLSWVEKKAMRQISIGVVYAPGEVDSHFDSMTADELEKAAHRALTKHVKVGLMHQKGTEGAGVVVESYINPKSYVTKDTSGKAQKIPAGAWIMAVRWEDDAWAAIQAGKIRGYSLQGMARSEPVTKAMTSFSNVLFGPTPSVREYPIEGQPSRDVQAQDDEIIRGMNERLHAAMEAWNGRVEDGTRQPEYAADSFPDGDESRQRPSRTSPEHPAGGYEMLLEDEEADLNDRGRENVAAPEVYRPTSSGARWPDPSNRVAGEIRKRGAAVSFVDVVFGK